MNRVIWLVLGLLALTGCTEQLDSTSSGGSSKTPPTYSQAYRSLQELRDTDAVAKIERRKADENALPADSTAFNLRPVLGESALDKVQKKCKQLLASYNKTAKEYNTLRRPRAGAPKDDPDLVIVVSWKTPNLQAAGLPFSCGDKEPPARDSR